MRKLKILTIAFLCALIVPVFAGCFGGGNPKLELHTSPAVYYAVGDSINLENAKVKYGENYVTITDNMVSGFSTATAGEKKMTVSYEGKSITINYTVFENVVNNAWYTCSLGEGSGYTYIKFNLQNKTMTGFTCDVSNINDVDFDEQNTFTYEYTQNVNSSGIIFSNTASNIGENRTATTTITNITTNSFTFRTITYENSSIVFDETMSFTKCN